MTRSLTASPAAGGTGLLLTLALAAVCAPQGATAQSSSAPLFEFSGRQRARYESLDPQFRSGFDDTDRVLALQTSLRFDVNLEHLRFSGEILDSRAELNDAGSLIDGGMVNTLEPIQAYVAWRTRGSTLRAGRMTLDIGKRRAIARSGFRNAVVSFAGVDWAWQDAGGRAARAFYLVPMQTQPLGTQALLANEFELDHGARGAALAGLYYQFAPLAHANKIEAYLIDYRVDPGTDVTRAIALLTPGLRVYRAVSPGQWSYEIETMLQRGEAGGVVAGQPRPDLEHRAATVHLEVGYAFERPWSPYLRLQYDRATGDKGPNDNRVERFNTLFGERSFDFGPTGIYGIAARSNLISPGLRLTIEPAPRWECEFAYRYLRLDRSRDAWVGSGWRDPTGGAGTAIGRHLEASFEWSAIAERLTVETGFAHLASGRFAKQAAGPAFRGDPSYFYASVTTRF